MDRIDTRHSDYVHYVTVMIWIISRVVLDFGSGKFGIGTFFGNPAKSGSVQISSQIWRMPVQLQYFRLILDKTNVADLSSGVILPGR